MGKRIKIKNIILKEGLITEDFNTQKELEMLTEDIFMIYMKDLITGKIMALKYNTYPSSWVFNKLEKGKYKSLNDFITNFALDFAFIKTMDARGGFKQMNEKTGAIRILYNIEDVVYVLKNLDTTQSMDKQIREVYFALRNKQILSTTLHELKHAYDFYRSKGKAIYNKKTDSYFNQKNVNHDKYLNMKHEVIARITQTLERVDGERHNDVNSYVNSFTKDFYGWDRMNDNNKKYLYKVASKHYYEGDAKKKEFEKKYNDIVNKKGE